MDYYEIDITEEKYKSVREYINDLNESEHKAFLYQNCLYRLSDWGEHNYDRVIKELSEFVNSNEFLSYIEHDIIVNNLSAQVTHRFMNLYIEKYRSDLRDQNIDIIIDGEKE